MADAESLRETLDELRAELGELERARGAAGELSEEERQALREAAREIERALGEEEDDEDSLRERLGDALERFGGEHPRLAALVNRVIVTLDYLGI